MMMKENEYEKKITTIIFDSRDWRTNNRIIELLEIRQQQQPKNIKIRLYQWFYDKQIVKKGSDYYEIRTTLEYDIKLKQPIL
ncbi:hypothetical protein DERP_000315 [Dermatophagoides pteronyssinus]|uniref:Uncharacterized protein n=1 Tax=Dermatophagoides pteronyssinus TaxID=6956 RepID=A0ABQ8IZT0_DERPT|nr:hypothetical protein DERP_000315 [Dermatophagoides pteronyssinus]